MKGLVLSIICIIIFSSYLNSQIWYQTVDKTGIIMFVDDYFYFPGKSDSITNFFTKNIEYPDSSFRNKIGGIVTVELSIDSTGRVFDSKIIKGINDEINNEVLRVCRILPNWIPYDKKLKRKFKIQNNQFSFKFDPLIQTK